jgi:transposase InsO family protein
MTPTGPDQLRGTDLTYLQVGRETAFPAVVQDAWSRSATGYAAGPILENRLPQAALEVAIESWRPLPGFLDHWHRGTPNASLRYWERLGEARLVGSMSCAGNLYNNAHVERFLKTLQPDLALSHHGGPADCASCLAVRYRQQQPPTLCPGLPPARAL